VAIAAVTSLSAAQAPADQPAARTDENSRIAHTQLLEKARGGLADHNDGKLYEGVMDDGLHPALAGYQIRADALKPIFTELLGPPGAEDHAPPPTGDPSR
jgi:lysophospholipase L1-like esterase